MNDPGLGPRRRDEYDIDLVSTWGRDPAAQMRQQAAIPSSGLTQAEHEMLQELTDAQLASVFSSMQPEENAALQVRHPGLAERVHLYHLRRLVTVAKAAYP